MSGFNRNRFAERHLVIPSATLSVVDIFSKPIFPEIGRAVSLREPKMNGERGGSRLGRLHVEAFQDTSNVVGLRQEKLSFGAMPTNLHSKYVCCRTEVPHGKFRLQFPNEFGELSGMPTGE